MFSYNDEQKFIMSIVSAVKEARSITRRDNHLDCRAERAYQFVTCLRRKLGTSLKLYNCICNSEYWADAGVPSERGKNQFATKPHIMKVLEVSMKLTQPYDSNNLSPEALLKEMEVLLDCGSYDSRQLDDLNDEASKVFEGFKQLAANL